MKINLVGVVYKFVDDETNKPVNVKIDIENKKIIRNDEENVGGFSDEVWKKIENAVKSADLENAKIKAFADVLSEALKK